MGTGLEVLLIASVTVGTVATVQGMEARKEARSASENAAGEQRKIQGEQKAQNAAQAATERRKQVREERVRRARVMQSAEASGVSESSGEFGALGALGTNLATNIGSNLVAVAAGERTSGYAQSAADFMGKAGAARSDAEQAGQIFSLSSSIFSASGGMGAIQKFNTPAADPIGNFYQRGSSGAGD